MTWGASNGPPERAAILRACERIACRGVPRLRRGAPSAGGLVGRPEPPMYSDRAQS